MPILHTTTYEGLLQSIRPRVIRDPGKVASRHLGKFRRRNPPYQTAKLLRNFDQLTGSSDRPTFATLVIKN